MNKTQLKKAMPSTSMKQGDGFAWRKRGGHSGTKIIQRSLEKFKALGFQPLKTQDFNHPDGSLVGCGDIYEDANGNRVEFLATYGVTQEYNSYSINLDIMS